MSEFGNKYKNVQGICEKSRWVQRNIMGCVTDKGCTQVSTWGTRNSFSGWGGHWLKKQSPSFLVPSLLPPQTMITPLGFTKTRETRQEQLTAWSSNLGLVIENKPWSRPLESSEGIRLWCSPQSRRRHSVTALASVLLRNQKSNTGNVFLVSKTPLFSLFCDQLRKNLRLQNSSTNHRSCRT